MMNEMQAKVRNWIGKDSPLVADNIIPPVATLPPPKTDDDKLVAAIAAVREADRVEVERLRLELGEALKDLHAEKCKSGLLELDLAQAANTIQTLQSEINERRHFASMMFDINQKTAKVLERFGTHPPPKKDRTPRPKKNSLPGNRQTATEAAKADG